MVPASSAAEEAPIFFPCRAAETEGGDAAVDAKASGAHQPNTGKERGARLPRAERAGGSPTRTGGSQFREWRTARQGKEPSRGLVALREEVGFHWMLPNGQDLPGLRKGAFSGGGGKGRVWEVGESQTALNPLCIPSFLPAGGICGCASPTPILFLGGRPPEPKLNLNSVRLITELVGRRFPRGKWNGGPPLACIQKVGEGIFLLAAAEAAGWRAGRRKRDEE